MNRYPLWKYITVLVAVVIGLLYTLPNFYGESPAVQISSAKATIKVEPALLPRVEQILADAKLPATSVYYEQNGTLGTVRARFSSTDIQLQARDLLDRSLNTVAGDPHYTVALNLLPASPPWMRTLGWFEPKPMYLGLDLRGGVHFLLQVDMQGALTARYDSLAADVRSVLRDQKIEVGAVERAGQAVLASFATADARDRGRDALRSRMADLQFTDRDEGGRFFLEGALSPQAVTRVQESALKQNINTLHNRINELGVAEPVIQQQGADRIVVQLPGVQDVAKAKELLGRTATLELRMVDDTPSSQSALANGTVPFGLERYTDRDGRPILVRRQVILTGENLQDAQPGRDHQTQQPSVNLTLDSKGARIFRDVTRDNVGKRIAILLFENGKGEVVTAPVIRSEIAGGQVQISGSMSAEEAADTALLLRAAPGRAHVHHRRAHHRPQPGRRQYRQGLLLDALWLYRDRGLHHRLLPPVRGLLDHRPDLQRAPAAGLAVHAAGHADAARHRGHRAHAGHGHRLQRADQRAHPRGAAGGRLAATGHLPWLRARMGHHPGLQPDHAHRRPGAAGLRLRPHPRFAVVHCLGILTSMFSSVVGVRALANLWYGRRKKLAAISIGTVWKPGTK